MPRLAENDALTAETEHFPAGPDRLEGELAHAGSALATRSVVFAGPHSLLGGTMRNNVIRGAGDGLAEHGIPTLRFDDRGVDGWLVCAILDHWPRYYGRGCPEGGRTVPGFLLTSVTREGGRRFSPSCPFPWGRRKPEAGSTLGQVLRPDRRNASQAAKPDLRRARSVIEQGGSHGLRA
jgi:hypothetical protein